MTAHKAKPAAFVALVRPVPGEPTTFDVASKSEPGVWRRCCISSHNGAGECQCPRWQPYCWPIIKATGKLPPKDRCRHLRAAREFCLNKKIEEFNLNHPSE